MIAPQLEARFWAKVQKTDACWLWVGANDGKGYGRINWGGGRKYRTAHRLAYELMVGPLEPGLVVDHLCRNPACVRPDHLEQVTLAENTLRGYGAPARNARRETCVHGHPFDELNTYIAPGGTRRACRTCRAERKRKYRARVHVEAPEIL